MSRVKKNIYGFLGLLVVAAMTIAACLVSPQNEAAAAASDVTVQVAIVGNEFSATITNPHDGEIFLDPNITVDIDYANSNLINVYITDGNGVDTLIGTYTDHTGTDSITINLNDYGGLGTYTIWMDGTDQSDSYMTGDAVSIRYAAINVELINDGTNTDPEIRVYFGLPVCMIGVSIYDGSTLIFGEYVVTTTSEDNLQGYKDIILPFRDNNILPGDYIISVTPYECTRTPMDDDISIGLRYDPDISVPKTGLFGISGLNLSRTDYLITGLVIFLSVCFFALFLLIRRKNQDRK